MPYVVADRVKETSTSTGTGNFTLAGAATGFQTFNSAIGVSNTTTYVITDATGAQWEVGLGTLSGSTTLVRTQVFSSSNAGSAVNFSAGTKTVFVSMSAAPNNNNTVFGTGAGFVPDTQSNTTVIGYGASSGGDGNTAVGYQANASGSEALAIGINSTASAFASVAVGRTSNASNTGATAVGPGAAASAFQSTAVGNDASASATGALAAGYGANASSANGVVLGYASSGLASSAPYDNAVVVGSASNTLGGITIGSNSPGSGKNGATIIGHGITPLEDDATYMNKFRTAVTPVGTSWFLKWDDSTNEVYADPGPSPAAPNWYSYQNDGFSSQTLSLALPSGTPTTTPGFGQDIWFNINNPSKAIGFPWSSSGSGGSFIDIYTTSSYPITDPVTNGSPPAQGLALCYFAGTATDAGTTSTASVYTGTSFYSNTAGSVGVNPQPFFGGPNTKGHGIAILSGNLVGSVTVVGGSNVTIVEEIYDIYGNYTYVFFDADQSGMSWILGGSPFLTLPSSMIFYYVTLWYNY